MWNAEPKKETFGVFKELNKKEEEKRSGIFGDSFGKSEEHPSKGLLGPSVNGNEEKTESEVNASELPFQQQDEPIKKMTFTVAEPLHTALKRYSNEKGYPMQFVLSQMIQEFLHQPRELSSSYQIQNVKRVKTTFDTEPSMHRQLNDFKGTHKIKIRYIIEALIEDKLRQAGYLQQG